LIWRGAIICNDRVIGYEGV